MFHIIDDEAVLRALIKALVGKTGHDALCFESGDQYLEHLESAGFEQPIAILTDVTMPGINGYDLTVEIRKVLPFQKIVLITGYADEKHNRFAASQLCYSVSNPFRADQIIALLTALTSCEAAHQEHGDSPGYFPQCKFGIDHDCPFHASNK